MKKSLKIFIWVCLLKGFSNSTNQDQPRRKTSLHNRMKGGKDVEYNKYPWQVLIFNRFTDKCLTQPNNVCPNPGDSFYKEHSCIAWWSWPYNIICSPNCHALSCHCIKTVIAEQSSCHNIQSVIATSRIYSIVHICTCFTWMSKGKHSW